jgi:superfamily II RNA helicase
MVKICDKPYDENEECTKYSSYFEEFPFPLSDFQKYAIQGIVERQHVLVTAHTGSGKTLPAEFAIKHFTKQGKKVIYTSPIKALSNQKFYEFSKAFPDISFGILTGDIKFNPEADVLIMTTEILQNTLYLQNYKNDDKASELLMFEMDMENELACVIFDEIHYINDKDRGKVWEETIMMLPQQIQMVMLSATIDKPEKFAKWCEEQKNTKSVYLASTNHRVVPLHHHLFVTSPEHLYKQIKDKDEIEQTRKQMDILMPVRSPGKGYHEESYLKSHRLLQKIEKHKTFISPNFVLNQVVKHCKNNEMLPAIAFVFSRKNVEKYADGVGEVVIDDMFPVPEVIERECEHIIRKLPNYKEYLNLPEYQKMVKLISKGIAIHHSGIMPILREMVELLFAKGFIKLLFATETFAVGLNMPTKSVIFTGVSKFSSETSGMRHLYSHEYTQMAGRAGRRGLDKIGHVIHCVNMYRQNMPTSNEMKQMLSGVPQTLVSKFSINCQLLLSIFQNIHETDNSNIHGHINKSMLYNEIHKQTKATEDEYTKCNDIYIKRAAMLNLDDMKALEEYNNIKNTLQGLQNKKRKVAQRDMDTIEEKYGKKWKLLLQQYDDLMKTKKELSVLSNQIEYGENYIQNTININLAFLEQCECVAKDSNSTSYKLTLKGEICSMVKEGPGLLLGDIVYNNTLNEFTLSEIVGLLSVFTPIKVNQDAKLQRPATNNVGLNDYIGELTANYIGKYDGIYNEELQFDIIQEVIDWVNADSEQECKQILYSLQQEKDVFLGEFVKALLKINHISIELESACNILGNVQLAKLLNSVSEKTLKYVATNQSLYI